MRTRAGACVVAAIVALACLPFPALSAADRLWHHYREVYDHLQLAKLAAVPVAKRDLVRVAFEVEPSVVDGGPLVFTVKSLSRPARLTVDATGAVEFPLDADWLREDPEILINLPADQRPKFKLDVTPRVPARTELGYRELMGGVPQANALIREQGGVLALFVPSMKGVMLHYDHPDKQEAIVGEGGSAHRYPLNRKGEIEIPFDPALLASNPRVVLSELPQRMDFTD